MIGEILQETYRLERLIGKGAMGVVYEASHLRFSRRFAVKVLPPALTASREMMARFRQEAEITGALGHPHILQVIDFNTTADGCPYIVMELLQGENLGDRMAREKQMTVQGVSAIFSQTASALDAVHQCGIVHRDLKPTNIFLCYDGRDDDFVRVLDFGISKVLGADEGLTAADAVLGSPQYMAPEQALGRSAEVDRRADVYAMGAILYEMLSGQAPFESATSLGDLLEQIVNLRPDPIRALRPGIPAALDRVITRALEKQPGDRFEAMADFWVAFEETLGRARHGTELSVARASAADPNALRAFLSGEVHLPPTEPISEPTVVEARRDPETTMPHNRWPWQQRAAGAAGPIDPDQTVIEERPAGRSQGDGPRRIHLAGGEPGREGRPEFGPAVIRDAPVRGGLRRSTTDPGFDDDGELTVPGGVPEDMLPSATERLRAFNPGPEVGLTRENPRLEITEQPDDEEEPDDEDPGPAADAASAGSAPRAAAAGSPPPPAWLLPVLVVAIVIVLGTAVGIIVWAATSRT